MVCRKECEWFSDLCADAEGRFCGRITKGGGGKVRRDWGGADMCSLWGGHDLGLRYELYLLGW